METEDANAAIGVNQHLKKEYLSDTLLDEGYKYLTSWFRIFWTAAFSILLRSNSGCVAMATRPSLRLEG
ncbi:hypothetical protein [Endozoicomonas sp. 2B-B]